MLPRYQKPVFKCELCQVCCENKGRLDFHYRGVHLKEKRFHCEECQYATFYKNMFRIHNEKYHGKRDLLETSDKNKPDKKRSVDSYTTCQICKKRLKQKYLSGHLNRHKENESFDGCRFPREYELQIRTLKGTLKDGYVTCKICRKRFQQKHAKNHLEREHPSLADSTNEYLTWTITASKEANTLPSGDSVGVVRVSSADTKADSAVNAHALNLSKDHQTSTEDEFVELTDACVQTDEQSLSIDQISSEDEFVELVDAFVQTDIQRLSNQQSISVFTPEMLLASEDELGSIKCSQFSCDDIIRIDISRQSNPTNKAFDLKISDNENDNAETITGSISDINDGNEDEFFEHREMLNATETLDSNKHSHFKGEERHSMKSEREILTNISFASKKPQNKHKDAETILRETEPYFWYLKDRIEGRMCAIMRNWFELRDALQNAAVKVEHDLCLRQMLLLKNIETYQKFPGGKVRFKKESFSNLKKDLASSLI